ncbi:MAG: (2Fe-2S)-binding protein [Marinilabiliales bacterium]|nr:MAG: (2Fe-2S)-binding protein [Marinilabiliales bacterium]
MDSNEKIICMCMDVTEKEIIDAIKNEKCKTVEQIGDITCAGTVCGGCQGIIQGILDNAIEE